MGQLEIPDPLVLYILGFLDTEVYSWWTEKQDFLFSARAFPPQAAFDMNKSRSPICQAEKKPEKVDFDLGPNFR